MITREKLVIVVKAAITKYIIMLAVCDFNALLCFFSVSMICSFIWFSLLLSFFCVHFFMALSFCVLISWFPHTVIIDLGEIGDHEFYGLYLRELEDREQLVQALQGQCISLFLSFFRFLSLCVLIFFLFFLYSSLINFLIILSLFNK